MGRWLRAAVREVPWRWVLYWLVVPNLLVILMWPIGALPMQPAWLIFGLAALLVSQLPWIWLKRLLLFSMIGAMSVYYMCMMYNINTLNIFVLPSFVREVRPLQSPEYLFGGLLVVGAASLALFKAPRLPRLSVRSAAIGMVAVLGLAFVDGVATADLGGSYRLTPQPGDPFSSAATETGLAAPDQQSGRHVVVILVESLGVPTKAPEMALYDADWRRPRWDDRYAVQHGTVPYYGSTTNGELRELCGRWGQYFEFDFAQAQCAPKRYGSAGYDTVAIHAFAPEFFARDKWYPMLGFSESEFRDQLLAKGARLCGGMWPGACDADVPAQIAERLKQADRPQFVYWVTLNTHLPVIADADLGTERCEIGDPQWRAENPHICRIYLLHHQLAEAIDAMVMDPQLPATDFLIVGDHMPAFFGRDSRVRFDPGNVPWIHLRSHEHVS